MTALDLPASWRDARVAAVISSGPDRPEPLTQFRPAPTAWAVTGHRLPNQPGADGRPLNRMALDLMAEGAPPQQAIDAVLAAHPEWDAGLIALHAQDGLGLGSSARGATTWARSSARDSRAAWRCCTTPSTRAACWPMSWADWPGPLTGQAGILQWLRLEQALSLRAATCDRVTVDAAGRIIGLETADPRPAGLNRRATAVCLGAEIWRDGRLIGHARTELYVEIRDGQAWPGGGAAQDFMLMRGRDGNG